MAPTGRGLLQPVLRRPDRRPLAGANDERDHRRGDDDVRPFRDGIRGLLFPALALVALGNGLFIPPLAIQVGSLYADDDPRKAFAYSAYYMGINLGGLLAPLVCGTLGELYGWHWGFTAAGVGMAIGLVIYCSFLRLLPPEPARGAIAREASDAAAPIIREHVAILLLMIAMVVLFRVGYEQSGNVIALWVSRLH